jgi:hypothetical protein
MSIALVGNPEEVSALAQELNNYPCRNNDGTDLITVELDTCILVIWNMNQLRYNLSYHDQIIEKANIIIYINPHFTDIYLCDNIKNKKNLWFTLSFKSITEIPTNFLESLIALKTRLESEKEACKTFPQKWMLIKSGTKTENKKPFNPKCIFNTLPREITEKILLECHRAITNNHSSQENTNLFFHLSLTTKKPELPEHNDLQKEKRRTCIIQ